MKMKIITVLTIVIVQMITQVFCYAREFCEELNKVSSSPLNVTEEPQSSADGGYISFTLDNKSKKTWSSGYGTWNHIKGYKYTTMFALDSDTSEMIIIAIDSNSKGTYRVNSRHLFNQIQYHGGTGKIMIAVGSLGEGTIKVTDYGSIGGFIKGTFNGILVDYSTKSVIGEKYAKKKHRIRGTFKVKRLSNIKQSVSNADENMNAADILKHEAAEAVYSVRENN